MEKIIKELLELVVILVYLGFYSETGLLKLGRGLKIQIFGVFYQNGGQKTVLLLVKLP